MLEEKEGVMRNAMTTRAPALLKKKKHTNVNTRSKYYFQGGRALARPSLSGMKEPPQSTAYSFYSCPPEGKHSTIAKVIFLLFCPVQEKNTNFHKVSPFHSVTVCT